ncbi:uncharacterized protein BXZ73DRAFT_102536 [Epithele typhae]|uniref:uncharacterized protein n=1 Tax=Epithele typhae TaxID=378194 RepID=UPI0020081A71|nr:uncharacterized protein BXZ73DRAFT_102536 [Epithele typhae]KAH9928031.1 hypothetical protein BXZ73DRAFT_102536 [Epithele typhae]
MPSPPLPVEIWEDTIDALAAAHEFESVAVCARVCTQWLPRSRLNIWHEVYLNTIDQLASVRHALECTPQLRGIVHSVHLHLMRGQRQDPALFNSAPVVLLPYLPYVEVWTFEAFWAFGVPGFRSFSRFSMACFRQYSSIKTLEIKGVQLATPLHLYRLVASFPKLQVLRLASIMWGKNADDPALPSSRMSIASLQELKSLYYSDPPVKRFHGHTGYVERLVISPSGVWAASVGICNSSGWSFNFIIWNTESEKLVLERWYDTYGVNLFLVSFAPTEALCAWRRPSHGVDIFRLPSQSEVAAGQRVRKVGCIKVGGHHHYVDHTWRPDGTQLVVLTLFGSLEVWDAVTLTLVQSFPSPSHILPIRINNDPTYDPSFIRISNDDRFVLHVCTFTPMPGPRQRCILVHDLVTGVCHSPFPSPDAPTPFCFEPVIQAVLRRDPARPHVQQVVVVRDDAPIVMLADVGTDSSLGGPVSLTLDIEPTQPHRGLLFQVSANGHRVLHTHDTALCTTYSVFDVGTGLAVSSVSFKNALQGYRRGVLSPDGRHVVLLALSYHKMWLWHVDDGTLHRIQGTMGCREWTAAEFSGDGATLGLGYSDGTVSFHIVQDIVRGQT